MHLSEECISFLDNAVRLVGLLVVVKFLCYNVIYEIIRGVRVHILSKFGAGIKFKSHYGKWAVVTGCTDGIGLAYSKELARRGMNLVLISRSQEKLDAVAKQIQIDYPQVQTLVIQADFSKDDRELYQRIWEHLKNIDVGILVNNVGTVNPYPMLMEEMDQQMIWDHVLVNVAACTLMTALVLPNMKAMRRGAIVNVSSSAAFAPLPYLSVYSATKIYIEYMSRGLKFECEGSGITVQTLYPGYVNTKMVGYSPRLTAGGLMIPSAETYARHAIATLGLTSNTTGYFTHGIQMWFTNLLPAPQWMFMNITNIINKFFRKEYDKIHAKSK